MNYTKIYNNIIERAKLRQTTNQLTSYKEIHHIVPKSMGGKDDKSNLVELTLKEHFLCHKLLIQIYKNNKSLVYALWMMANTRNNVNNINKYNISAKEYERLRILYIKSKCGTKLNSVQKQFISESTQNGMLIPEIRQKCSKNKGSKWYYNKETLKTYKWKQGDIIPDMKIYHWGRPMMSAEQKQKLSKTQRNKINNNDVEYYIIPNSYNNINNNKTDCIIYINEYKDYTNKYNKINIPDNWIKINKKTTKQHSIRKQLYKILVQNDNYIKYCYRTSIDNNNYNKKLQKYFWVDPIIYKILSEHICNYTDWTDNTKIINILNNYL